MAESGASEGYEELLRRAEVDDNVVGVLAVGPRAANVYVHPGSDIDAYVVLRRRDDSWQTPHGSTVEVWALTLDEFSEHAMPGSRDEWNRPTFLYARVDLDRLGGQIGEIVRRKAHLDASETRAIGERALDAYINSLYRSLKNLEHGRVLEGRLDAIESVSPFLTTAFALEGRVRPFNKWLRHELEHRPLAWTNFAALVETMATDPSPTSQRRAFNELEPRARVAGWADVVDGWAPDVDWLRGVSA